jgi:hypothetical protein
MTDSLQAADEVFMTSSTKLATALLSLGNTLRRPPCTRQVRKDGSQIVTFLFNPTNESAIISCGKIAKRWTELEAEDPNDATEEALRARIEWLNKLSKSKDPVDFAYSISAWRDLALLIVKSTPRMIEIKLGAAFAAFVREDASPDEIKELQKHI